MRSMNRAGRAAFAAALWVSAGAALAVAGCDQGRSPTEARSEIPSPPPAGPTHPGGSNPAIGSVAFIVDVNTLTGAIRVTSPGGAGPANGSNAALQPAGEKGGSRSLLAGDAIGLVASNLTTSPVGDPAAGRRRVDFDVAIRNRLGGVRLVTPTFPAPPAGVQGLILFPFSSVATVDSGGVSTTGDGTTVVVELPGDSGLVAPSQEWDGAAFNFFNDEGCPASGNDCYRYEAYPQPLEPQQSTAPQRVGFVVDPTVRTFRARLIVAADLQNVGLVTAKQPLAFALVPQASVRPIISVGDTIPGTATPWAPIPDGLGAFLERGRLVVLANHELSDRAIAGPNGAQFTHARISRLEIDPASLGVIAGKYLLDGSEGFLRLCSATLATLKEGFSSLVFLTGEEVGEGRQLAVRPDGSHTVVRSMGLFAHENQVAVPGFADRIVSFGLDDTRGKSELYMHVAGSEADIFSDRGTLYVFRADEVPNAGALSAGQTISGRFVEISNAASLSAEQLQAKVEELGAFPFVRLEDGSYDRRENRGAPALYFVDTGSNRVPDQTKPWDPYGSIYRLELDPSDPTRNARLMLLARSAGPASEWASPDNVATSANSLMVQEDPAHPDFARAPRIWRFPLRGNGGIGTPQAVVELDNPRCRDGSDQPDDTCWESSGIIDVSEFLGAGTWLFDVQAHGLPVPELGITEEGGQLLLLRLPGS